MDKALQEAKRSYTNGELTGLELYRLGLRSGLKPSEAVRSLDIDPTEVPGARYEGNNSGGYFRTDDEHWHALEAAGWIVDWVEGSENYAFARDGRYFGQLAARATAPGMTVEEAIDSFRRVTGLNPYERGCTECCGPPHHFYED